MVLYGVLILVNVACFLPLYALNYRDAPNPFEFLLATDKTAAQRRLKLVYARVACTDPFRINFDFTFIMLLAVGFGYEAPWLIACSAGLLTFGFVEILYSSVMQSVFKRPPALVSDLSLLNAGLKLAQRQAYWLVPAALLLLGGIAIASYQVTALLFRLMPQHVVVPLVGAALLLPPCLYHWRSYSYTHFLARTVYSPVLHFARNLGYSKRLKRLLSKDAAHFDRRNHFKDVALASTPNIVVVCVESYGSTVYRDPEHSASIDDLVGEYERRLTGSGYRFASTYSAAPIFAGGSWLSYASFTYGIEFADLQLFDGVFAHDTAFAAYESLFHVLKRNGYRNVLLCPLGGVDVRSVDWAAIDRCFQSDLKLDFAALDYRGPLVNYFGLVRRYAPLDQYSLNFGYDAAAGADQGPFSLFFCTLNSHIPWSTATATVANWRTLNEPQASLGEFPGTVAERYRAAIRYQLDYVLRFVCERADDDAIIVVFGDHQPPFITAEHMGKQTPVHVIARNPKLIDVFLEHGFAPRIGLSGIEPRHMRHEGFLSLFLKAMQAAYGKTPDRDIDYREHGVALFDELDLNDRPAPHATT